MPKYTEMIKHQESIFKNRIKRAKVLKEMLNKLTLEDIDKAINDGYSKMKDMTKDKIISEFIDDMDALMIGIFNE
ncbi:MAG: hypothetical protein GY853_15670 [PVC group bacterium]|nr:hypothetical protein [PVC group bacterium]